MIWSGYYYIKIFVINWEKIEKRKYDTLYHYTISGNGQFANFINSYGDKKKKIMYLLAHFGSNVFAFIISALMLRYHFIAVLGLIAYIASPISKGARYMVQFHTKSYYAKLESRLRQKKSDS